MHSEQTQIRPEPTVVLIEDVLDDMARGQVRVPAFQRPFVWKAKQMLELFDSIERGYPIGSLLLWQPDQRVESLDRIAGLPIPEAPAGRPVSYILDGNQCLSTMFGVLRRPPAERPADLERDWIWRVYRDLRFDPFDTDRYLHHRPSGRPVPPHLLPLSAVLRTMDFLGHFRQVELHKMERRQLETLIREAEAVAQRIKNYKLTVVRLPGASIEQAVNVYARLNRTGTRMDPDQMVSALTYRPQQLSLANRIDDIVSSIAEDGFGELPRLAVFRSLLAVADESDVMSPRWDVLARQMQNKLHDALPATERAVELAVDFLRNAVGVPLAQLLPYSHQLVLLAKFFHHCPEPTQAQVETLRQWFWVTSWTSAFGGASSTMLRRALQDMRSYATGRAVLPIEDAGAQPMPADFNLNSARTRAYVIWELSEFPHRLDALGQPFDVVKEFAAGGAQSYRQVVAGDRRPANRLILRTSPGVRPLEALKNLEYTAGQTAVDVWPGVLAGLVVPSESPARQVLRSHGIPATGWRQLCNGRPALFVADRAKLFEELLRDFAAEIGLSLDDQLEGSADDDSE